MKQKISDEDIENMINAETKLFTPEFQKIIYAMSDLASREKIEEEVGETVKEIVNIILGKKDGVAILALSYVISCLLSTKEAFEVFDMIKDIAKVDQRKINNVTVFEKFSFLTVPFEEAERILNAFKKQKKGRKPIVERAKEKKKRSIKE